jgi:nucleotide-binding universal stress UspA family protein
MATKKMKKALLAIDGSDRGLQTVKNAAKFAPFKNMHIHLFHVFNSVPESYWDLEREPKSIQSIGYIRAWEAEERKNIARYMEKAQQHFIKAGFSSASISKEAHDRKKGIARDIIHEAHNNYDLVITRRRGFTGIRGIIVGSVAEKLLSKLSFVPVVVIGRKPMNNKVLIALDGSESAQRAVAFIGDVLSGHDSQIRLVHVIRARNGEMAKNRQLSAPEGFAREREREIEKVFADAKRQLNRFGFKAGQIQTETIISVPSRAAAIAGEAEANDCSTIVMGRRGLSKPKEFSMGRVTHKVIRVAKLYTLWVVP